MSPGDLHTRTIPAPALRDASPNSIAASASSLCAAYLGERLNKHIITSVRGHYIPTVTLTKRSKFRRAQKNDPQVVYVNASPKPLTFTPETQQRHKHEAVPANLPNGAEARFVRNVKSRSGLQIRDAIVSRNGLQVKKKKKQK